MKSKPKFRVGQRVRFTVEGTIEEMNKDFLYVRMIVQKKIQGDGGEVVHHVEGRAVLYHKEARPLREREREREANRDRREQGRSDESA